MNPFTGQTHLNEAGFIHFETCHCGGILQHKFKRKGDLKTRKGYPVQISVFPTIGRFKKFKFGTLVDQGILSQLKDKITNEQGS